MRHACVFCGTALTPETRAIKRSPLTRSGVVTSNKSWCRDCDDGTAAVRARRLLWVEASRRQRARQPDKNREYNRRPEVQARKREWRKREAWRKGRTGFRCAGCGGRWKKQREAWRLIDGRRERLGLCTHCARERVGASRHDTPRAPRGGWAAYLRARRRDKGTSARRQAAA